MKACFSKKLINIFKNKKICGIMNKAGCQDLTEDIQDSKYSTTGKNMKIMNN